ncbi:nucleoside hydrolase [Amycolatopsis samaneae]|uniref:Nucleoside hydrolase n=1 Tax=Amycolatopsis samaneae TaxID=664691 RepID=A0ABW5G891_9PSEU
MIFPRLTRVALAAALVCAASTAVPAVASAESDARRAVPVVFDHDMDFDDAATLAYLCQAKKQGRIDLRAVTVTNNGSGTPGRALTHVRTELERCGLPGIPVADGSPAGVNPQPQEGRAWTERVLTGALGDGDRPDRPSAIPAWLLLAESVLTAPRPVVVIATGPLTNVAKALAVPGVASRISRLSVMGGAFAVPGNIYGPGAARFDGSQEVNMWLDPASAARVFGRLPGRVDIAPLDATNDVPVTQSFVDKLGTGRTPEARLVHAILTQPDAAAGIAAGSAYWWDTLAASVVFDRVSPVRQRVDRVAVRQDGAAAGRTVTVPDGTPQRVGHHAELAQYERGYFAMLTGG